MYSFYRFLVLLIKFLRKEWFQIIVFVVVIAVIFIRTHKTKNEYIWDVICEIETKGEGVVMFTKDNEGNVCYTKLSQPYGLKKIIVMPKKMFKPLFPKELKEEAPIKVKE